MEFLARYSQLWNRFRSKWNAHLAESESNRLMIRAYALGLAHARVYFTVNGSKNPLNSTQPHTHTATFHREGFCTLSVDCERVDFHSAGIYMKREGSYISHDAAGKELHIYRHSVSLLTSYLCILCCAKFFFEPAHFNPVL